MHDILQYLQPSEDAQGRFPRSVIKKILFCIYNWGQHTAFLLRDRVDLTSNVSPAVQGTRRSGHYAAHSTLHLRSSRYKLNTAPARLLPSFTKFSSLLTRPVQLLLHLLLHLACKPKAESALGPCFQWLPLTCGGTSVVRSVYADIARITH